MTPDQDVGKKARICAHRWYQPTPSGAAFDCCVCETRKKKGQQRASCADCPDSICRKCRDDWEPSPASDADMDEDDGGKASGGLLAAIGNTLAKVLSPGRATNSSHEHHWGTKPEKIAAGTACMKCSKAKMRTSNGHRCDVEGCNAHLCKECLQ